MHTIQNEDSKPDVLHRVLHEKWKTLGCYWLCPHELDAKELLPT
jgi:hypothetical protein